jgi:hypothetical protein
MRFLTRRKTPTEELKDAAIEALVNALDDDDKRAAKRATTGVRALAGCQEFVGSGSRANNGTPNEEESAMAKQQPVASTQSRSERDLARYEQELADYLQERIKPGLNRGAIPLVARSIAKEIASRGYPNGGSVDADKRDEPSAEADDEPSAESEAPPDFEADMHELQADLGEDWILRFSVHGDEGWLTAEKDDGSQRVEAATASELVDAVERLDQDDGESD